MGSGNISVLNTGYCIARRWHINLWKITRGQHGALPTAQREEKRSDRLNLQALTAGDSWFCWYLENIWWITVSVISVWTGVQPSPRKPTPHWWDIAVIAGFKVEYSVSSEVIMDSASIENNPKYGWIYDGRSDCLLVWPLHGQDCYQLEFWVGLESTCVLSKLAFLCS